MWEKRPLLLIGWCFCVFFSFFFTISLGRHWFDSDASRRCFFIVACNKRDKCSKHFNELLYSWMIGRVLCFLRKCVCVWCIYFHIQLYCLSSRNLFSAPLLKQKKNILNVSIYSSAKRLMAMSRNQQNSQTLNIHTRFSNDLAAYWKKLYSCKLTIFGAYTMTCPRMDECDRPILWQTQTHTHTHSLASVAKVAVVVGECNWFDR